MSRRCWNGFGVRGWGFEVRSKTTSNLESTRKRRRPTMWVTPLWAARNLELVLQNDGRALRRHGDDALTAAFHGARACESEHCATAVRLDRRDLPDHMEGLPSKDRGTETNAPRPAERAHMLGEAPRLERHHHPGDMRAGGDKRAVLRRGRVMHRVRI